jgi:hypothetical protein
MANPQVPAAAAVHAISSGTVTEAQAWQFAIKVTEKFR